MSFYLWSKGKQSEALSLEEIRNLWKQKQISKDTLVWHEGLSDWIRFDQIQTKLLSRTRKKTEQPRSGPDPKTSARREERVATKNSVEQKSNVSEHTFLHGRCTICGFDKDFILNTNFHCIKTNEDRQALDQFRKSVISSPSESDLAAVRAMGLIMFIVGLLLSFILIGIPFILLGVFAMLAPRLCHRWIYG